MTLQAGCPCPEQGLSDFFVQSLKVLFAGRTFFRDVTELNGLDAGIENAVDFLQEGRFDPGGFSQDDYTIEIIFIQCGYSFCQIFINEYLI